MFVTRPSCGAETLPLNPPLKVRKTGFDICLLSSAVEVKGRMPSLLGTSIRLPNHTVSWTDSIVLATSVVLLSCTCRRRAEILRALTSKKKI